MDPTIIDTQKENNSTFDIILSSCWHILTKLSFNPYELKLKRHHNHKTSTEEKLVHQRSFQRDLSVPGRGILI